MANGQVNLTISDRRVGNGLGALASDADKATAAFGMSRQSVSDFGKGLGKLAPGLRNIGGMLNNLALGGIWQAGAAIASEAWNRMRDAAAKAAKDIAERFGGTVPAAIDRQINKLSILEKSYHAASEASKRSAKVIDDLEKQAVATDRLTKANIELARQKRIANGEDEAKVNADADAELSRADRESKERAAAAGVAAAEKNVEAMRNAADEARESVRRLKAELSKLQEQRYIRANQLWIEQNAFAGKAGMKLSRGAEQSFMESRADDEYKKKQDEIKAKVKEIEAAEGKVRDAVTRTVDAMREKERSLVAQQAAIKENEAAEIKAANDAAEAKRKAWEAELEAAAKIEEEREKAAQKAADEAAELEGKRADAMIEEMKKANEEYLAKIAKAEEKARKKKADKDIAQIKKVNAERIAAIDREIAKAREEAAIWERNAQGARQTTPGKWARQQRQRERQEGREQSKWYRRVVNAERELAREEKRIGGGDKRRIAQLREFLAAQDPANNPAAKRAQALEKERNDMAAKMQRDIADILATLKDHVAL